MLFRLYTSYTTLLIICAIAESSMKVLETYRQNRHIHFAIVSPNANIAKKIKILCTMCSLKSCTVNVESIFCECRSLGRYDESIFLGII